MDKLQKQKLSTTELLRQNQIVYSVKRYLVQLRTTNATVVSIKRLDIKRIVCDKCGVEVTTKDVRKKRMGHIKLAVPVTHVWFAYGIPNKMSIVDIIRVLSHIVIYYTKSIWL